MKKSFINRMVGIKINLFRSALKALWSTFKNDACTTIEDYSFPKNFDIRKDIQEKYQYDGVLLDIFIENKT